MKLNTFLLFAGALHLGLVWAGATVPGVINLRAHLAELPPLVRRLFWVYFTFIGLTLFGFGLITFCFAQALADGSPLSRALCGFLAVFWTLRLVIAAFVFDVRPYLTTPYYRLGYHATTAVFIYLAATYACVAFH